MIVFCIFMMIFYVVFDNSPSVFETMKEVKEMNIEKMKFQELDKIMKPPKWKERINYIKLPNEVEVILFNATQNKKMKKNAIGVIVGSGAMNDDKVEGLAHLTEHMLFLVRKN
jgi:secreted Zn-dependent insulinase-like peptidase